MATPREKFGKDYAAGIAASLDPRIQYRMSQLGSLRPEEELFEDVRGFYDPAIAAAARIGEDVSTVGQSGLAALGGLVSGLPGLGERGADMLADAARGVGRAGGTAALVGGVAGTSARQALASDLLATRRMREDEEKRIGEDLMMAESEKARLGADWLPYAAQRQQMATVATQNRMLLEDLKNAPIARRRSILENRLLSGQITGQDLQNAGLRKELKSLGISDKALNAIMGTPNGPKRTTTKGPDAA